MLLQKYHFVLLVSWYIVIIWAKFYIDNARRRDRDVPGDDGDDGEQPRAAQRQRRPHRQLHVQAGALVWELKQGQGGMCDDDEG